MKDVDLTIPLHAAVVSWPQVPADTSALQNIFWIPTAAPALSLLLHLGSLISLIEDQHGS